MSDFPDGIKAKQVPLTWYADLGDFISQQLGRNFNVLDDGEYSQDGLATFWIEKDPDATEKVQKWLDSPQPANSWDHQPDRPDTNTVLSELANRGIVPEKKLYVHIWW